MKAKAFLFFSVFLITVWLRAKESVNIPSSKENFHLFLLMDNQRVVPRVLAKRSRIWVMITEMEITGLNREMEPMKPTAI